MGVVAALCLILFGISIAVTYLSVRLNWLQWQAAGLSGFIFSALFLFSYSLIKGDSLANSIVKGLLMGLIFTAAALAIGAFFRVNSEKSENQASNSVR